MAPGLPTRRRSNSSGATRSSQAQGPKSTTAATTTTPAPAPTVTSSRPKRRGRGLPLAARSTSISSVDDGSNPVAAVASPPPPETTVVPSQDRPSRPSRNASRSASTGSIPATAKNSASTSNSTTVLQAILPNTSDKEKATHKVQLSIKLSGKKFDPTLPAEELPLGQDGNTFYCQGCGGVGDVVCCDGCPHVFHRDCVPTGPSRKSLEQDDDPWYCPDCVTAQQKTCFECNELGINLKQCENCEGWIHFPSCHPDDDEFEESDDDSPRKTKKLELDPHRILCRICRVEEMETASHDSVSATSSPPSSTRPKRTAASKTNKEAVVPTTRETKRQTTNTKTAKAKLIPKKQDDKERNDKVNDNDDGASEGDSKKKQVPANSKVEVEVDEDEDDSHDSPKPDNDEDEEEGDEDDDNENEKDKEIKEGIEKDTNEASSPQHDDSIKSTSAKKTLLRTKILPKRNTRKRSIDEESNNPESPKEPTITIKKRSRPSLPSSKVKENMELAAEEASISTPNKKVKTKVDKKKKKKSDKPSTIATNTSSQQGEDDDGNSIASSHALSTNGAYPRATPAFFFFLNENRLKIERSLARRHRIFNRLPKGYERNELVAKEGALWWTKLRDSEIRRYMTMSMRDFEQHVIEWKEEKNIREMLLDETEIDGDEEPMDTSFEDELVTYENHQRLYLGTTVGSKPFKPEPGTSHNRVLLELLQDMRFHPMPMVMANRPEVEYGQMDFDRITIPYFDVHGPFSTSVGDECLGCTRGWTHFCHVLKRRIPAVEHRAKLQPPLSSLMATRVGLGLRPRPVELPQEGETEESNKNLPLFSTREVADVTAARKLPVAPCDSLSDPSSRADDIVQFIEETISMKVPEPARPDFPSRVNNDAIKKGAQATAGGRGSLPRQPGPKRAYDTIGGTDDHRQEILNKCGRCRTVISTDTGCIQCRRAQLVINMSKRGPPTEMSPKNGGKNMEKGTANNAMPAVNVSSNTMIPQPKNNLKVQTFMCGRLNIKDGTGEVQSETDVAIANGILRQRWIPFAILPPHTIDSPTPKSKLGHRPRDSRAEDQDDPTIDYVSASKQADVSREVENQGDDVSVSSRSKDESMDVDDDTASTDPATQDGRPATAKRVRSARIAAGTNSASQTDSLGDDDRQELAIRYKEDADELHKRCLGVACCGILLALMRRDPLLLFASPVTAEGYSSIIKNPIDFGKIRRNVLEDQYGTLGSFVSDCRLLCTNALAYNPPGSIYWKTAKELYDVLAIMQRRVSDWMTAVKDAHAMAWRRARNSKVIAKETVSEDSPAWTPEILVDDPFVELRKRWPEAVEMLEDSDWLRRCISADFMRTRENETAYYGALAVRRTAAASEAALAAYPDSGGIYNPVARRTYLEDEALRRAIDDRVAKITHPVELKDLPSWREEAIIRVLRRAQNRRFDGITGSNNGCARCDGNPSDPELKRSKPKQPSFLARNKRKNNEASRIDPSRIDLSTGMASQATRARLQGIRAELSDEKDTNERAKAANGVAVSVQGSGIHGWGLFADQFFKKGDVVAEYIGEYVSLAVTEAREKMYQEQRIQDYQFRVDDQLVIDATMRGGHGRYINHNCNPNCVAKIIPGIPPNEHLKRVIIIAQRDIEPREELTYDYQFPLELDLEARIPCNCMSEHCRGFMNWDLPEKGSNTHVFRAQKRGANMRDRIRRLGRPLKSDKGDDVDDLD